jgi:tape measure domain-containing protein
MANYSYGGLSVSVVADTRALTSQVAGASRAAGEKASRNITGQLTKGFASVGKAGVKSIGAIAAVAGGGATAFVASAVKAGVAYNVLYSKSLQAFKTVLGSQKAAEQMMSNIEKFGKTSPFPRQAFIQASQQMLAFGYSAKDVIPTLTAVQDAVAATGGSADDIQGIVTVLAKVKSSGKITAVTLNELGKRGINAAELIGKGMGKSAEDIRGQITAGSLDANKALSILTTQMEAKYKGAAAGLKSTWTGAKDSIKGAMRDIGSALVEPFISKKGGGLAITWANDLSSTLWKLKPAVEPLVNAFMKSLAPAIAEVNKGVEWLIKQVGAVADPKRLPAATKAVEKFGAAGLAAFGGVAAIAGGSLLTQLPVIGSLISTIIGPVKALGVAFTGLSAPVAIVVIAIAALIALVTIASPKFRAAVGGFAKAFMSALVPAIKALMDGVKQLWPILLNFGKIVGDNLAPIIQKLMPLLAPLGQLLAAVFGVLFKELGIAFKVLGVALQIVLPILGWIIGILVPIVTVIIQLVTWVVRMAGVFNQLTVIQVVLTAIGIAVQAFAGAMVAAWNWVLNATRMVWQVIVSVIQIAWQVIVTAITIYFIIVKAIFTLWWTVVSAIVKWAWGLIGGYVMGALNWIKGIVLAAWSWLAGITTAVWNAIVAAIMVPVNWVKAAIGVALAWIKSVISQAWGWIRSTSATAWNAISGVIIGVFNTLKGGILNALNWIKGIIAQVFNFLLGIARSIWNQIYGAISGPLNLIKGAVGAALGWIKSTMSAGWNSAFSTVKDIWGKIAGFIGDTWKKLKDGAGKAAGDIIGGLKDGFVNALKDIGKWVNDHLVQPIIKAVKDHFKIGSPSKVMAGLGGDLIAGLFKGLNPGNWGKIAKTIFGGLPEALGALVGKGVIAMEKLPAQALSALGGIAGKIGGVFSGLFGGGGKGPNVGSGVKRWEGVAMQALTMLGHPEMLGLAMSQMQNESGGDPNIVNTWDSNAKAGHPSMGLMQTIPSTFAAFAGPLRGRGIFDPLANIYAGMNYAIQTYGKRIYAVLGHGHGYAAGGVISEPVAGLGLRSGDPYYLGEKGPEVVSPLLPGGVTAGESRMLGELRRARSSGSAIINVYPRAMQSETEIAAAVSRNLQWAAAGGAS